MIDKKTFFIVIGVLQLLVVCCSTSYLEQDAIKRIETYEKFLAQKKLANNRANELFSVFDKDITGTEREALEFLYAYMPLSDLANHNGEYFLSQVRYALKTRSSFSWGKTVPDNLFLHFVLPYRVNNEDVDSARMVFYKELKDRVQNLSMRNAALEVNHWCHEKVSYQPTDIRTSGPLSTIRSAFGRCGEESTFTVTAMRAVGIPARQIYTPRWAHSDDNHAWVEVWVDGEWYFLGACEPQPQLDMGWFAGPATRAMLLHTRVFGNYSTNDDVVTRNNKYTELNVISDYAPAKRLYVRVKDSLGNVVKDANVEFQLYNYAEFYPLAKALTDENGVCSLLTGYGDLVIWASKKGKIAYQKATIAKLDTLELTLRGYNSVIKEQQFALVPPLLGNIAEASEIGVQENTERLHKEDSIRSVYESTFIDSMSIVKISEDLNIDALMLFKIFKESCGNWKVIKEFVYRYAASDKGKVMALLTVIADKDRRDVRYSVLVDHFENSDKSVCKNQKIFNKYVLNPRITNELLTPYKKTIQDYFGDEFIQRTRKDVSVLLNWITDSVQIVTDENTARNPMFPEGVMRLKVADKTSRDIFLVAALRSFGIPSCLEEARRIPQLLKEDKWIELSFETLSKEQKPKGDVMITWEPSHKGPPIPQYYLQFTIARFNGSTFKTLDYEFSDLFDSYPVKLSLDEGEYMIVTGLRESDGTVWARRAYFEVQKEKEVTVPIQFATPKVSTDNQNVEVDLHYKLNDLSSEKEIKLADFDKGNGVVLIWIDPDREPTKHLVNDLIRLKEAYEAWDGQIVMVIEPKKLTSGFKLDNYKKLPSNVTFYKDVKDVKSQFLKSLGSTRFIEYPMAFVITHKGELVYTSSGYKIGSGDEILSKLNTFCLIH